MIARPAVESAHPRLKSRGIDISAPLSQGWEGRSTVNNDGLTHHLRINELVLRVCRF